MITHGVKPKLNVSRKKSAELQRIGKIIQKDINVASDSAWDLLRKRIYRSNIKPGYSKPGLYYMDGARTCIEMD